MVTDLTIVFGTAFLFVITVLVHQQRPTVHIGAVITVIQDPGTSI